MKNKILISLITTSFLLPFSANALILNADFSPNVLYSLDDEFTFTCHDNSLTDILVIPSDETGTVVEGWDCSIGQPLTLRTIDSDTSRWVLNSSYTVIEASSWDIVDVTCSGNYDTCTYAEMVVSPYYLGDVIEPLEYITNPFLSLDNLNLALSSPLTSIDSVAESSMSTIFLFVGLLIAAGFAWRFLKQEFGNSIDKPTFHQLETSANHQVKRFKKNSRKWFGM